MKFKFLITFSLLAIISLASWLALSGDKKISSFSLRENRMTGDFYGALPYMKKLRGNLVTGEFEASDFLEVARAVEAHDRNHAGERSMDLAWWEMGPDNVGGRTRAILAVNNNLIFAGSVTGGLYKSLNGGNNWERVQSLDAFGKTMAISCIDQTEDGTIYIGTGCTFEGGGGNGSSGAIGVGMYRSTDLGATWSEVPGTIPTSFNANSSWAYINDIEADANDPDRIWIAAEAGVGYYDAGENVLNMDINGISSGAGIDIEWSVDGSYCLVVTNNTRIWRSTNGGNNFSSIEQDNVDGNNNYDMDGSRAVVAISPTDPNKCYAFYSNNQGFMGGLFYSTDKGSTWHVSFPPGNDESFNVFGTGQGRYDLAVTVNPENPDMAWVGGVTLWRAGTAVQPEQIAYNFGFGGLENYVHSDIHTFEFAPNGDWYIGCDGGVFKSVDNGLTFTAMNRGYNVTQFYNIAHSGGYPVMGGTQDNGTQVIVGLGNGFVNVITDQQAFELMGGDGFGCDMSQNTQGTNLLFGSSYYGTIERYDPSGSGGLFYDNEIINLAGDNLGSVNGGFGIFYTPCRLFEDTEDEDSQQFIWAVNPTNQTISDTTITLFTSNLNLPFDYYIPADEPLHFWPVLQRPAFSSPILYTMDPNYPWLEAQESVAVQDCDTTLVEVGIDTTQIITPISITVYWNDSIFYNNTWIYYTDSLDVVVDYDTTYTYETIYNSQVNCTTTYNYIADQLQNVKEQRLVKDEYTSVFVTAFNGTEGIWITRQALNLNVTPDWWRITDAPGGGVKCFEFSPDGNTLWVGGWNGSLRRITGLDDCYSAADAAALDVTTVIVAGPVITSIAVDPNNSNRVMITHGGYGTNSNGKVRISNNANATNPTFNNNIWQFSGDEADLEKMPVYSGIIDVSNPDRIVVGTEFGVYASDDGGQNWQHTSDIGEYPGRPVSQSVGKLTYTPVLDLKQQKIGNKRYMNTDNYGVIYAGTHGRGIFRSNNLQTVSVEEPETIVASQISIYPSPSAGPVYAEIQLDQAVEKANINVYDINGKWVRSINRGNLSSGSHKISLDAELLPAGTYIVTVDAGKSGGVARFVKM